ncbi:MAG TPA: hypothetical protein VFZ08_11320 [Terriglobia bacterium]|nr:hypothetical protein [Terriglobia bacterium]
MLKISVEKIGEITKFKLEGKLAGPWVAEFERSWQTLNADCRGACIAVDLSDVTYVDAEGQKLLAQMCRQGVHLNASGVMTRSIIEQIERACAASGDVSQTGG